MMATAIARFWARVDKNGPIPAHAPELGPCWVWIGGKNNSGYGNLTLNGESVQAHRVAWKLSNGEVPEGQFVLHRCDNRPCCRPSHLFLGDHQANSDDKMNKNRGRWNKGEANHKAKLTADDVATIRAELSAGASNRSMEHRFNVSQATISHIKTGRKWK